MSVRTLYLLMSTLAVMVFADTKECIYNEREGRINCRGSGLHNIPYHYFENKSFHTLDLGVNNITSLSHLERFLDLHARDQIKTIYLDHNQISHIPKNLFKIFPNLQRLDLSYNKLKHIPRCFCHMTALTELNLEGNCIETTSKNAFTCLKNVSVSSGNCTSSIISNLEQTRNDVESFVRPTLQTSTHKVDTDPVEKDVKKTGKGSAVSASENLCIIVIFSLSSILIAVFYKT